MNNVSNSHEAEKVTYAKSVIRNHRPQGFGIKKKYMAFVSAPFKGRHVLVRLCRHVINQ